MALASGIGATLEQIGDHATAFGEDQGRYVVTSRNPETIQAAGFPMTRIGTTGGASIRGAGRDVSLDELRRVHEGFFPGLMGADAALRSEEHTSELQSLMRISYAVFCLKKKK